MVEVKYWGIVYIAMLACVERDETEEGCEIAATECAAEPE